MAEMDKEGKVSVKPEGGKDMPLTGKGPTLDKQAPEVKQKDESQYKGLDKDSTH